MVLMRSLAFVLFPCASVFAEQAPLLSNGIQSSSSSADLPTASSTDELLSLHKKLIEHESITGNEKSVGDWLASYLADAGLTVEKQEVAKDRFNVLAYPGKTRETKILVSSHIDTVPPYWPYEVKNEGTEVWGRGSVDAKACVAAQTIAVLDLLKEDTVKKEGDISLLFVVGEEKSGDGMRFFSENKPTNYTAVVFGEPTEGKLAAGHKGILGWIINVQGKASHSGYPSLGLSANNILIEALAQMLWLEKDLPYSEKYGNSTLNVGRVEGGVAFNVVAETAKAEIALRIANGSVDAIKHMINGRLKPIIAKAQEAGGNLTLDWPGRPYSVVDLDHDIPGFDTITVNYGTDVPNLDGDHKRYLYGPGSILVAHSDHEHLKVSELVQAVEDYKTIILSVLEKSE